MIPAPGCDVNNECPNDHLTKGKVKVKVKVKKALKTS